MKSLWHYYTISMGCFALAIVAILWAAVFDVRPEVFLLWVLAPGLTIVMLFFALGVVQHMRGKIEL